MRDVLEYFPIYLKIGILLAISLSLLGFWLDKYVRNRFQKKIADAWQRIDKGSWPNSFLRLYDHLLTSPASSIGRPRIWRSASLSLVSLLVITIGWLPSAFSESNSHSSWYEEPVLALSIILIYIIPVNVLGDYFSYWETRIIVGVMANTKRNLVRFFFVLVDFAVTTLIFLAAMLPGTVFLVAVLYAAGMHSTQHILDDTIDGFRDFVLSAGWLFASASDLKLNALGVLYFTTMTTSIWVWTYMIGSLLWPLALLVKKIIAVERRPIGFAMTIGGVVLGLLVAAIGGVIDCVFPLIEWTLKEAVTPS